MERRSVVKIWDNTQEVGYVKGLTFYNKNGATKKFQAEWQMRNWLQSMGAMLA
jgi:hypothetical protein